jgi:hypothetical protein
MKIKVGDKVTIIALDRDNHGKTFVVTNVRNRLYGPDGIVYVGELGAWDEGEVVPSEVFESPLYKAIHED